MGLTNPDIKISRLKVPAYVRVFLRFFRCGLGRFGVTFRHAGDPAIRAPRKAASNCRCVSSSENLVLSMPKRRPVGYFQDAKGKKYPFKLHSASSAKAAFRPYAALLGTLAFSWNQLHDNLSRLFRIVVNPVSFPNLPYKIWFALDNDYLQRKILRAAVEVNFDLTEQQRKDIFWVLNQIDESLRFKRNDALHAPLMLTSGIVDDAVRTWAEANKGSFSPRADALRNKDLIAEFEGYIALSEILVSYVAGMIMHFQIRDGSHPWPQRPTSPHAHRKKSERDRRRRAKLPPHLRGSS